MHGEGNIMVDPAHRPVAIPAVAYIESLEFIEIGLGLGPVEFHTDPLQPEIDQNAEEFPVIVDEFPLAGGQKIGGDSLPVRFGKRLPDMFGNHGKRKSYRRQFDQPLVPISRIAPIFGMGGVGALGQSTPVEIPMGKIITAGGERNDAP